MIFLRTTTFVTIFAFAVSLSPAAAPVAQNVNTQDMDRSVKPGDNFYWFANGGWLKTVAVPTGQPSYGTSTMLIEKTSERVRNLIQEAAAAKPARGSIAQKVGDYYASFMDEGAVEARGLTPLADELTAIGAITNKASLSAYLGTTLNPEVDGLTANADHVFGVWVNQSFTDSRHYVFHLLQGGLGMPDRDDYIDPSPKMSALRAQYQAHIAALRRTREHLRLRRPARLLVDRRRLGEVPRGGGEAGGAV